MTFAQALTRLRLDILAEQSEEYFEDTDLDAFVRQAAAEIAEDFGFPTKQSSVPVNEGDSSFPVPSDALNIELNEVAYGMFTLVLRPFRQILQMRDATSLGVPRYYNFDQKAVTEPKVAHFAPRAPRDGMIHFEYVAAYDAVSPASSDPIWHGQFPAFHNLVLYAAAVKAFDASLEEQRSGYWAQRYQARAQEFAAHLNKQPLNSLIMEEEAPS